MGTIVSNVMDALTGVGIRADEAYPGRRIPALTGAVAAVRLGKMDRAVRSTAVQVIVMSPAASGGSLCESTALRAVEVLQSMGGTCVKDVCRFDEMADVFFCEIETAFFGTAVDGAWLAGPGYAIKIGEQNMPCVISFVAERATDNEVTKLSDAKWQFTLKELLPPGGSEPPDPTEPFNLKVTRSNSDELFSGCKWISVKREETQRGISQTRVGEATSRSVIGIL